METNTITYLLLSLMSNLIAFLFVMIIIKIKNGKEELVQNGK